MRRRSSDITQEEKAAWQAETASDVSSRLSKQAVPEALKPDENPTIRQMSPLASWWKKCLAPSSKPTPTRVDGEDNAQMPSVMLGDVERYWLEQENAQAEGACESATFKENAAGPKPAKTKKTIPVEEAPFVAPVLPQKDLSPHTTDPLEPKRAKRFMNPKHKRDATLDLHGMAQDVAYDAVVHFIDNAWHHRKRNLRIITGKGAGILQSQLVHWLNNRHLRPKITAISHASAKEGGNGVLLLLLKRR